MSNVIKSVMRRGGNLLRGRSKTLSESVNFERANALLEEAQKKGVDSFDVVAFRGGNSPIKDPNSRYKTVDEALRTDFHPHEKYLGAEWVYRLGVEGEHEVYAGKNEEVHYLDVRSILFGGCHRWEDGGKKPHAHHWMTVKYRVPISASIPS